MPFYDWLVRFGRIIHALVQPCVEDLEGLVRIVGFPELIVIFCQVCVQDPRVVRVQVAQELERGCSGVAHERVLEGREVVVVERRQYLIAEFSVDVTKSIVFLTLFGVLTQ